MYEKALIALLGGVRPVEGLQLQLHLLLPVLVQDGLRVVLQTFLAGRRVVAGLAFDQLQENFGCVLVHRGDAA